MTSEHSAGTEGLPHLGVAAHWRQTLWAMVGIQFVMTAIVMTANLVSVYHRVLEYRYAARETSA